MMTQIKLMKPLRNSMKEHRQVGNSLALLALADRRRQTLESIVWFRKLFLNVITSEHMSGQ